MWIKTNADNCMGMLLQIDNELIGSVYIDDCNKSTAELVVKRKCGREAMRLAANKDDIMRHFETLSSAISVMATDKDKNKVLDVVTLYGTESPSHVEFRTCCECCNECGGDGDGDDDDDDYFL